MMDPSSDESEEPKSSRRLGRYSLVAEIARGGMGVIYLAQAESKAGFWAKKLVVIKHLKPEHAEDDNLREMFLDEARLAARLHHRNIVQTIEVVEEQHENEAQLALAPPNLGPRHFFVMEYLEGRTLKSALTRLKGPKALTLPMILRVACQVLAGLHYAHELTDEDGAPLRVVHRDVSAHNVFLTYDGQVKLLDFGVAKAFGRIHVTDAGVLKGRVDCMSPEYLEEEPVDRRADVFAVGVLLREALTGKRVWEGMSEVEILKELLAKKIPPFPSGHSDIPQEIRDLIEKAMSPAPDDRFRTAHAMRAAIEQYVARVDPAAKALPEMAALLSKAFAEHRARVKELVEQHETGVQKGIKTGLELPSFPMSVMEMQAVSVPPSSPSGAPSSSSAPVAPTPTPPPASSSSSIEPGAKGATPSPPPATAAASSVPSLPVVASADPPEDEEAPKTSVPVVQRSALEEAASIPPRRERSGKGGIILASVFAIAASAAGIATYLHHQSSTASSSSSSPAVASVAPPPASTPSPVVIAEAAAAASAASSEGLATEAQLTIHATPDIAQIFVDDSTSGKNPFSAKLARGEHTIRVTAPGHLPKTEVVNLMDAMSMTLVLERGASPSQSQPATLAARPGFRAPPPTRVTAPTPTPSQAAAAPPTAPAAPPAAPAPAPAPAVSDVFGGGTAPKRSIDSKTPYE